MSTWTGDQFGGTPVFVEGMENEMILCIKQGDDVQITKLLKKGANATLVTNNGLTAIGYAASMGKSDLLDILLRSCSNDGGGNNIINSKIRPAAADEDDDEESGEHDGRSEPKKMKTPDAMDALQWEDEIQSETVVHDDEWSKLYVYYAQIIEKTGDILSNSIRTKEPHCLDTYNHAPIHYASIYGHLKCVQLLLDYQCPVDLTTVLGQTPLHLSVNYPSIVQTLLARGANPNKKNYSSGETALHRAVLVSQVNVVEQLLAAGADVNAATNRDQTALMLAAAQSNTTITRMLIERHTIINAHDENGQTALYLAVMRDNVELVEHLLSSGARCTARHYLLHYCVRNDRPEMLRLLVNNDQKCINTRDLSGWTPVYLAIYERNAPMIAYLLEHGALLDCQDWFRKELQIIIQHSPTCDSFRPTAYILLQNGVDIDTYNYWNETPLTQAIMLEKYQIAEFLVKEGADVNTGDADHFPNSLLLLRRTDNIHLLHLLLKAGMKIHCFTPRELQLKPGPWPKPDDCIEDFLAVNYLRPFGLQQLSRIVIRNRLIDNIRVRSDRKNRNHLDGSMLKHSVRATGLPTLLQAYVYDFTDVPPVCEVPPVDD